MEYNKEDIFAIAEEIKGLSVQSIANKLEIYFADAKKSACDKEIKQKSEKWDKLKTKVDEIYSEDDPDGLITIGEATIKALGRF